jgi:phytoene dehydrogenase-like protein
MTRIVADGDSITVIGGGITGLAAASFLVLGGHDPAQITVLEHGGHWGGHARTLYLFTDEAGDVRLVSDYSIDVGDPARPLLRPSTPTPAFLSQFPDGSVPLAGASARHGA